MIASPTDPATARCWAASRGLACAFPALGASLWSKRRGRGEGSSGDELGAAARGPPETWRKARDAPHPLRPGARARHARSCGGGHGARAPVHAHVCASSLVSSPEHVPVANPLAHTHSRADTGRHGGAHRGAAESRRGGGAAPLFASGGGKLSQRHDHERQHHAGGQQGGDDDGRDGAGPQRACGGRRATSAPSPAPPPLPASPTPTPGTPAPPGPYRRPGPDAPAPCCPRGWARRWAPAERWPRAPAQGWCSPPGLLPTAIRQARSTGWARAPAGLRLQGQGQVWGPGGRDGAPAVSRPGRGAVCGAQGGSCPPVSRGRGAGWATEAEGPGVAPEPLPRPGGPPHRLPSASERTD